MPIPAKPRSPRLSASIGCAGALGLLAAVSCTSSPAPARVFENAAVAPTRSVIDRATEHFYTGKQSALEGDFACAEVSFQQALDAVAPEGGSTDGSAEVQEFSASLFDSILRYEAMAEAATEPEPPEGRGTPDELKDISGQASAAELARAREQIGTDERAVSFDIPVTVNESVISMVATFISRDSVRERFAQGLARAGRFLPMIRSIFEREGLPGDLAYVAMIESSFKTSAHSRARAHGVWQFIASTGRRYGLKSNRALDERSDPVKSTAAAAKYFRDLYDIFGDWYLAMAAYDSGEGRVARAISRVGSDSYWDLCRAGALPRETRLYVPSVIAAALIAKNPGHYGFNVESAPALAFETVLLQKPVSLRRVSAATGVSYPALKDLNPELKTDVTPQTSGGYSLRLPPGSQETVEAQLASLPAAPAPSPGLRHRVRKGETLARVARRFGVTLAALAEANDLAPRASLSPRMVLVIPDREPAVRRAAKKTGSKHHKKPVKQAARPAVIPAEGFAPASTGAGVPESTAPSTGAKAAPASP
jgi:membrane-bound lytic murein transglycosylase D